MTARGIRLNNPGNIRKSKDKWQGLSNDQPDKEFFRFKDACYGIRAMARILIKYYDDYNLECVSDIINRWAPPVENDTEAYIKHVCNQTGFLKKQKLNLQSYDHLAPLVKAIIKHENGHQPYSDAQITKGLVLAGVEPEKKKITPTMKAAPVAATAAAGYPTIELINHVSPTFPLLGQIAEYAPYVLGLIVILACVYIYTAHLKDRKEGLL